MVNAYHESLRPSPAAWLLVPGIAVMAGLAMLPLGPVVSVIAAVAGGVLVVLLLALRTPALTVTTDGFRAGPAFLGADYLGRVEALDSAQTRAALGPHLREDAHVLHRAWIPTAVRVQVEDDADPTPYWLVSTRHPARLADALQACRDSSDGQAAHSEQTG